MKLMVVVVGVWLFLYSVFLFPVLESEISNANMTTPLAPVIEQFPLIFLVLSIIVPLFIGYKGRKQ